MKLDIKYYMLYDSIIYGILEKANYKVVKSFGVMRWDLGGRWWYEETVFGMLELFWMKGVVNIQLVKTHGTVYHKEWFLIYIN